MQLLSPLNDNPSLDRLAYEKIKEAILSFRFLPNQALVEGELATQLGISKTPVRDALMRLEKEGLVSRVAYKGTYVSDVNNQDMANIYEIRIVLEELAIRLAVETLSDDDLKKMDQMITAHSEALSKKEFSVVSEINSEFHNTIIQKCSNPRLIDMLHNLDDHLKRYRLLSITQVMRTEKSVLEHKEILAALYTRDVEKAEQAMRAHLLSAMHDLYDQNFEELVQNIHNLPIPEE
jgi:DNA-binding GntR family transcriptional regulator